MKFGRKLDRKDAPYVIVDEAIEMVSGRGEGFLKHDNIIEKTVEVYTGPEKSGNKVMNFTIEMKSGLEWRRYIVVFAQADTVYVTYECYGDTVEAADVNELQSAAELTDENLRMVDADLQAFKKRRDNPHNVTKAQVGLGSADNTADIDKPVSTVQREAMDKIVSDSNAADAELRRSIAAHEARLDNPHEVKKVQIGLGSVDDTADIDKPVSTAQREAMDIIIAEMNEADAVLTERMAAHESDTTNSHKVTKAQVGLGNVDDVKQASKTDFDAHTADAVKHLTASERQSWNDKYTKAEVDNKFSALETATDWKESVGTYADISATYPEPQDGWTVNVKDTNYTYRYDGTGWVAISANAIPKATQQIDGLLTATDKTAYDDANAKKHVHSNKSVLDGITSALINTWNAAHTHIADAVKHITSAERTLWNTVSNKVDKISGKGLSTNDYTTAEKDKLAGITQKADKKETHVFLGWITIDSDETVKSFIQKKTQEGVFMGEFFAADLEDVPKDSEYTGFFIRYTGHVNTASVAIEAMGPYTNSDVFYTRFDRFTGSLSPWMKYAAMQEITAIQDKVLWKPDNWKTPSDLPSAYPSSQTTIFYADSTEWKTALGTGTYGACIKTEKKSDFYVFQSVAGYQDQPLAYRLASARDSWGKWKTYATAQQIIAANDQTPTFTQAGTRANIVSGEKLSIIFGKVMKFFADLKTVAFSGSYNDLTDKPTIPGVPSSLPPSGAAGGDLSGTYPNPSVKDNSHSHTKSNITDFPASMPANGGTATYTNYVNANNIAASTNMDSLTTPGFYYCPANATAATLTNCPVSNAFFMIVGKHAGTYQMLIEYMASGFRIRARNMYSGTWGSWVAIYTANEKPTPAAIGAAPASHTHAYLPTGGVTWNQLRGQ